MGFNGPVIKKHFLCVFPMRPTEQKMRTFCKASRIHIQQPKSEDVIYFGKSFSVSTIYGHSKWFLKNCVSFLWSKEIIVIGYNLVSFLHNCMKNIFVSTKCNVLSNNQHLIIIWFKNYFENIKFRKSSRILLKILKMLIFLKSFQYQSKINRVIQIKKNV